jgi:cyanophycin synthetase
MIAHVMKGMGRKVGLTSTDGIYVDGRIVRKADASGPKSASMVLQNPTVDFAVFEVARGGILREGLGYQRNDVAVVLNVTGDHLGLGGITSLKQLAEVKRVIVEAVPRDGVAVLNADDSMDPEHERLKFQASRGRRAVTVEQGRNGEKIVLRHGRKSMDLVWTHLIPATFEGRARMNVQNALAASAAAWAAGAHLHDIRQGLRTFTTSYFMAPGRLNMFELDGYRVVVDYAHNPPAMTALGEFVERLSEPSAGGARAFVTGRRIGVVATAGDRREVGSRPAISTISSVARSITTAAGRAARRPRSSPRASTRRHPTSGGSARSRPSSTSSRRPARRSISPVTATWWSCASIMLDADDEVDLDL